MAMTAVELRHVRDELAEIYKPEGVEIWLHAPHKLLAGRRAIDCEAVDVLRLIDQLHSGAF